MVMNKKHKSQKPIKALKSTPEVVSSDYFEGDHLEDLLLKLRRSVEFAKASKGELSEKIWIKQQFAIGINDVTRILERMPPAQPGCHSNDAKTGNALCRSPLVPLQAVLLATDCTPKRLTKHIPSMASTRRVPVISLKDNRGSSLRLGELVNVRTALAIGVKARCSTINKTIDEVLASSKSAADPIDTTHQTHIYGFWARGWLLESGMSIQH